MWIPVKTDDAVRATVALACPPVGEWVKAEALAMQEGLPVRFLENILGDLRRAGIVCGRRGYCGGYRLSRPPEEIDVASILAAVGSPLVVNEPSPRATAVADLWNAVSQATLRLLERCSLADLAAGRLLPGDLGVH